MLHSRDQVVPVWWTHATDRHVLTGWADGRRARNLTARPAGEVLERAIGALGRCLREDARELVKMVEWFRAHDWQSDPYARGAYSVERSGESDAILQLAKPVLPSLFFAGEATHPGGQQATVHGAIATGIRAAHEVMASLH
jgi:monoamine oxidase